MTKEQVKGLTKKVTNDVTRDFITRKEHGWSAPWPKKLCDKARRDEYIDLTELRQETISGYDKQIKADLPDSKFQLVYKGSTNNKDKVTSPLEWLALTTNYLDLLRHLGYSID